MFVLFLIAALGFLILTCFRPLTTLAILALYLPFESVFLKLAPDEMYVYARFFSEGLIYVLAAVVIWRALTGAIRLQSTRADLPFILFLVILLASVAINAVSPTVAILGTRQIIRFILVFFVAVQLKPSRDYVRNLTLALLAVVGLESVLGIVQSLSGGSLDATLLPSDAHSLGEVTLTGGVDEFWEPGSRVFATLGRYDRLGNFLYFFLALAVGFAYEFFFKRRGSAPILERGSSWRAEIIALFAVAIPTLVLTYSRASWFAFLLAFLFVAVWIKRDRRVMLAAITVVVAVVAYVGITGLNVRYITEAPGQTLVERFYETFSYARWRGEYYGLGRVYWMVQTPLTVVAASPLFGFGPGQFGGGAVVALGNTKVYEQLGLPFGVFGTDGIIDNNWFSLWGETGCLGIFFFLWMYLGLIVHCVRVYRRSSDPFTRALSIGVAAAMLGVAMNAFLSTVFEIRTLAFYVWMYAGFVVVLGEDGLKAERRKA
ncbi:MAG: O-antigen ligase family protein [Candidatus Uhrbacteria bacterium]